MQDARVGPDVKSWEGRDSLAAGKSEMSQGNKLYPAVLTHKAMVENLTTLSLLSVFLLVSFAVGE